IVEARFWTRVHTPGRLDPCRRIVPAASADDFLLTSGWPFGISHIAVHESFGKPIGHPFVSVARQVVDAIGAFASVPATNRCKPAGVRIVPGLRKNRAFRSEFVVSPRVAAAIVATR